MLISRLIEALTVSNHTHVTDVSRLVHEPTDLVCTLPLALVPALHLLQFLRHLPMVKLLQSFFVNVWIHDAEVRELTP